MTKFNWTVARNQVGPYAVLLAFLLAWLSLVGWLPSATRGEDARIVSGPYLLIVLAVLFVPGAFLISTIGTDQIRRIEAKRRLGEVLSHCSETDIEWLRKAVEIRVRFPILHPDIPELWPVSEQKSFIDLWLFLMHDNWGQIASDALFQRSRAGRRKYFSDVVERARESRRPQ